MSMEETFVKYPGLRKTFETGQEMDDGREAQLLKWIKSRDEYAAMKNDPHAILAAIDDFSGQLDFLINLGKHKADVLTDLMLAAKPITCVEFGGYLGYSAILIGTVMKQYAADAHLWSFELNQGYAAIATELVEHAGLSDTVTIVVGSAIDSASQLQQKGALETTDMLLLDHVEDMYLDDFKKCKEMGFIARGSLIIADNVVRPGAPEYRAYVRSLEGLESKGVRGLITPGDWEDEFEVTTIL